MNRNEKVLVLGGSYFIGLHLVQKLLDNNYSVSTLNRGSFKNIHGTDVKELYCDRNNSNELKKTLADEYFDYVIDVSGLNKDHVMKSYEAIKDKKIKAYLFISSCAVYKENNKLPIKENDEIGENKNWNEYGLNKVNAERFLYEKWLNEELPIIIVRPAYVYGEGNYVYREGYVFDRLLENRPILVPNDGETVIQYIHIDDLCNSILELIKDDASIGDIFNIGNQQGISFFDWIKYSQAVVKKETPIIKFDYEKHGYTPRDFFPFNDCSNVLDVNKISKIYAPKTNFVEGLARSYEWYKHNSEKVERRPRYIQNEKKILETITW